MNAPDHGPDASLVELSELNQAYADCLDSGDLCTWPNLFTADGVYKAQGRENFDRGLPLTAMFCDGRGMFEDRVTVITKIMVYAPRYLRHIVSAPRMLGNAGPLIRARTSFSIFHTLPHEPTTLLSVGRYEDEVLVDPTGAMKFRLRVAVYDSLLIPNSLVYPL
jgi:3-phenylpropionate/cinnamic acid dioxygenase small subunit